MTLGPAAVERDPQDHQLLFVANRTDGFGGRLITLLHAIVAANIYSGRVALDWRVMTFAPIAEFHDVISDAETFSQGYLNKVSICDDELALLRPVEAEGVVLDSCGQILVPQGVNAIIMRPGTPPFLRVSGRLDGKLYAEAFDSIGFSASLEYAKDLARSVELGDSCVAVHLRSGDIVSGPLRNAGGFIHKIVPFQIAERAVEKIVSDGRDILIFGQDQDSCREISRRCGVRYTADLDAYASLNGTQRALFDICLMARCDESLQGLSAFSSLAGKIGDVRALTLRDLISPREAIDITLSHVASASRQSSALQSAFAVLYTLVEFSEDISDDERATLIDHCRSCDPENPLYLTMKAHDLYRRGESNKAELLFLDGIQGDRFPRGLMWLWANHEHYNILDSLRRVFCDSAEQKNPIIALLLSFRSLRAGDRNATKKFWDIYVSNRKSIRTVLDKNVEAYLTASD